MKKILILFACISIFILIIFGLFGSLEATFTQFLSKDKPALELVGLSFLIMVSDIILPVPSTLVMLFNGSLFGIFWGSMLSIISNLVSCSLGFWIGKKSKKWMSKISSSEEQESANRFLAKYGFYGLMFSRGIPILAEAVAVISGTGKMKFSSFVLACVLGLLPISFLYAYTGKMALDGTSNFLISLAINTFLIIVTWVLRGKLLKRK